jgi:hypothetical protein
MSTIISSLFNINGVIDTKKTVLANINDICTAVGCWMTYDIAEGQWAVIINKASPTKATFDDANIIGSVNLAGTGINELYNGVSIDFPHKDFRDQTDYVEYEIQAGDRFPNELDNVLKITTQLINEPVQAAYIAGVELKQSRLDKTIEFTTDFTRIGLKAGDIIAVTNEPLGFQGKLFRIMKLQENDDEIISVNITALEFDPDIYDPSDLNRKVRIKKTGIVPKSANQAISDQQQSVNNGNMISATAGSFNTVVPTETELGTEQGGDQEGPGGDASIAPRNVYALTFLAPLTGTYLVQVNFDQNNSGARGGRGVFFEEESDYVAFRSRLFLFEAPFTQLFNENSGGLGGNAWIDYFMSGEVQLEAGKTYSLVFTSNIYTESNLGQECDVTVSWNVFTVGP